jgi:hypothetical protein
MRTLANVVLAGMAALASGGCGTAGVPARATWTVQVSATSGAALVRAEYGSETLRIACRRNPADLLVTAAHPAGRSGPVRLAIGTAAFDLQADADAPMLAATGPLSAALPAALAAGGTIALHRDGTMAAFGRPDRATATAFAAACRNGP